MAFKTKKEKFAFKIGFKRGKESKSNTSKNSKSNNDKKIKTYSFQAFNSNLDVFNVDAPGYSRAEALKHARKYLKKDPEHTHYEVNISNARADKDKFYRTIRVDRNGGIHDNWEPYYK